MGKLTRNCWFYWNLKTALWWVEKQRHNREVDVLTMKNSKIRIFFKKLIKDGKLLLWFFLYFNYRCGNFFIWNGSSPVGLDVYLSDWLTSWVS